MCGNCTNVHATHTLLLVHRGSGERKCVHCFTLAMLLYRIQNESGFKEEYGDVKPPADEKDAKDVIMVSSFMKNMLYAVSPLWKKVDEEQVEKRKVRRVKERDHRRKGHEAAGMKRIQRQTRCAAAGTAGDSDDQASLMTQVMECNGEHDGRLCTMGTVEWRVRRTTR